MTSKLYLTIVIDRWLY